MAAAVPGGAVVGDGEAGGVGVVVGVGVAFCC